MLLTSHRLRSTKLLCGALMLCASAAHAASDVLEGGPFIPTPPVVVDAMLKIARVGPRDYVVDLGSGDGRIVLTAARKFGARGFGVDIDAELVERSNAAARKLGVAERVHFLRQDVRNADLRRATVLTLYLLPGMMEILRPKFLKELRPGARIVSHDFDLGDWKPDRSVTVETPEKYDQTGQTWTSTVHLWVVPAAVQGNWRGAWSDPGGGEFRLEIRQTFQRFGGSLVHAGASVKLEGGRIDGTRLQFGAQGASGSPRELFVGAVEGGSMKGEVRRADGTVTARWSAVRIP
jgi:SAM-dependent methyltransferase